MSNVAILQCDSQHDLFMMFRRSIICFDLNAKQTITLIILLLLLWLHYIYVFVRIEDLKFTLAELNILRRTANVSTCLTKKLSLHGTVLYDTLGERAQILNVDKDFCATFHTSHMTHRLYSVLHSDNVLGHGLVSTGFGTVEHLFYQLENVDAEEAEAVQCTNRLESCLTKILTKKCKAFIASFTEMSNGHMGTVCRQAAEKNELTLIVTITSRFDALLSQPKRQWLAFDKSIGRLRKSACHGAARMLSQPISFRIAEFSGKLFSHNFRSFNNIFNVCLFR